MKTEGGFTPGLDGCPDSEPTGAGQSRKALAGFSTVNGDAFTVTRDLGLGEVCNGSTSSAVHVSPETIRLRVDFGRNEPITPRFRVC